MPKISVALIVRNEAENIPTCLSSVRDHVDEIIVVDTGSTDDTKRIVRQFTEKIFDFVWCDDFGKARQFAFDQATGDWVFWMDADDILVGGEHLRGEIAAAPPEMNDMQWKYIYMTNGVPTLEHWRERCVRNDGSFRWVGRVHETLQTEQADNRFYSQKIYLEHHQQHQPTRSRRNLNILEAEAAELGAAVSPRTLFYLGNEYMEYGEWDKAAESYRRYLQRGGWQDERYFAAIRLGRSLRNLTRFDEALDAYLSALKERPDFPHAYFGLAEIYYYQQAWDRVIHWAEIGERMPSPVTTLFLVKTEWEYDWLIHYTNALYHVGRLQDALEWTNYALQLRPEDAYHLSNKTYFLKHVDALIRSQMNAF
jgi:glycosyltransferase involved in cell wall biosynthesis